MRISDEAFELASRLLGQCLEEASAGEPFRGRVATEVLGSGEGEGQVGVLAEDDEMDARELGRRFIEENAGSLRLAIVIVDATLTGADGSERQSAAIDIFERGEPEGYSIAQVYRLESEDGPGEPEGNAKLVGTLPQLLA